MSEASGPLLWALVSSSSGNERGESMGTVLLGAMDRQLAARRGRQLEILTIVWGACEALIAIAAAYKGHSASLAGFGLDSVIEVVSASALIWRMSQEMDHHRRHRAEHMSLRIAGVCLFALAAYVFGASVWGLTHQLPVETNWLGIGITAAALIFMPLLSRAKRAVGRTLNSSAMMTDARQTDFCSYQAGIVLFGLAVHSALGYNWADSAAGLLLVPIIVHAGVLSLRGQHCC
jgi:divalent metal cation (Fe/Co/Zn/Cd) transporter